MHSTKQLFSFNELIISTNYLHIKRKNYFCLANEIYLVNKEIEGQRNINLKIEFWSLFCIDLQKEQDSDTPGSG